MLPKACWYSTSLTVQRRPWGAISLLQALSFLFFAPVGGSVADCFDRRRLLLLTQSLLMSLAVLLGALTMAGLIRFWMIPVAAFTSSAILSFDQPARNALAASLAPKVSLMNAVSLQSAVFNGASILGPALAGLALNAIGYAGNFFLNAASYSAVLVALLPLRSSPVPAVARPRGAWLGSVREGLQHVRRNAVLPSIVFAYGTLLFFGPSAALVLPIFARQIAHVGSAQLGILFSAVGAGTVVRALIVASLGDFTPAAWIPRALDHGFRGVWFEHHPNRISSGAGRSGSGAGHCWGNNHHIAPVACPARNARPRDELNRLLIMCVRPLGNFPVAAVLTVTRKRIFRSIRPTPGS